MVVDPKSYSSVTTTTTFLVDKDDAFDDNNYLNQPTKKSNTYNDGVQGRIRGRDIWTYAY